MKKIRLNIDDREVLGLPGQTILEVAKENNIFIPTLCYDERAEIYGSCGICVVEVEGSPKLFKACATEIAPNMIIKTNTERVRESRKTNLELLLSNHNGDCKAPCSLGCPANTDCQGYVGLIANGLHKAALKLVKDKIPLPASIGRVCPHPCESDCRRGLVEQPIAIKELKRFVGDRDLNSDDPYIPEIAKATGKKVAISTKGQEQTYICVANIEDSITTFVGDNSAASDGNGENTMSQLEELFEKPIAKKIVSLDLLKDCQINNFIFSKKEDSLAVAYSKGNGVRRVNIYNANEGDIISKAINEEFNEAEYNIDELGFNAEEFIFNVSKVNSTGNADEKEGQYSFDIKSYEIKKL